MQQNLFTEGEMTTSRPTITKPNVSRSTFYQGDCLIEMDKIADKSIDMILCDLPYGTTACKWDVIIPFDKLWVQYNRVVKDNGAIVLTASQPFTSALVASNFKLFRYEWIWVKNKKTGFCDVKYRPLKQHESILTFSKSSPNFSSKIRVKYYPQGLIEVNELKTISKNKFSSSLDKAGKKHEGRTYLKSHKNYPTSILFFDSATKTIHPTQKPVELMEYLIKTYTNEGDTVLDNCMGSGTTGVACRNTNRHFIGIEQDKKYFDIAVKRVFA